MGAIKMSRELAYAASMDAGNRAMRAGRRKAWNDEDYNVVMREFVRLWPNCPHGLEPQNCSFCFTTLDELGRKL